MLNTGTVVGREGNDLRTTNGGQSWIMQYSEQLELWLMEYALLMKATELLLVIKEQYFEPQMEDTTRISQSSGTTKYLRRASFTDAKIMELLLVKAELILRTNKWWYTSRI